MKIPAAIQFFINAWFVLFVGFILASTIMLSVQFDPSVVASRNLCNQFVNDLDAGKYAEAHKLLSRYNQYKNPVKALKAKWEEVHKYLGDKPINWDGGGELVSHDPKYVSFNYSVVRPYEIPIRVLRLSVAPENGTGKLQIADIVWNP